MRRRLMAILTFLSLLISCGKTNEEKVQSELNSAEIDLTRGDCDSALSKLVGITNQDDNAKFLKLLASAYACKAGYKTTVFFTDDLPKLDANFLLSSFTLFSTSDVMNSPTQEDYLNIQRAVNVLKFAGGFPTSTDPTSALRKLRFTSKESAQIHSFLMFLLMVNLGQYSYYYGNTGATGIKGAGTNVNDCFMKYDAAMITAIGGSGGSCDNAADSGHPNLDPGTVNFTNACEGVALINAFIDVIPEVIASASGTDFSELGNFDPNVIKTAASAALTFAGKGTDILDKTSAVTCKSDITDEDTFRYYFAMFFDILHSKT